MSRPKEAVNSTSNRNVNSLGKSRSDLQKPMTPRESQIYGLLIHEFLTPTQISRRLGISKSNVSNVLTRLRKKGFINKVNYTPVNHTYTGMGMVHFDVAGHPIRLHAERYRIRIIHSSEKYRKAREQADSTTIDGNRVVLYRDVIMVFSYQSFMGQDDEEVDAAAVRYWLRFFSRLEVEYSIIILKERSKNIRRVHAEYAERHNELAEEHRKQREKLRVFSSGDGKTWLLIDDSFSGDELEAVHAPSSKDDRDAKEDIVAVQRWFNDIRDNKPPPPSEQAKRHELLLEAVEKLMDERFIEKIAQKTAEQVVQKGPEKPMEKPHYVG